MNFTCDKCDRRYSIADEKVRGKSVRIRCKNCQNVILVEGPSREESTRVVSIEDVERLRQQARPPGASPPAPPAEPQPSGPSWFAIVRGKQEGPLDERGLRELVGAGSLSGKSFLWQQGMPEWKRMAEIHELASLLRTEAPPAPAEAAPSPSAPALGELFSDLDLPTHPVAPRKRPEADPFAAFDDASTSGPPGEATQFFIAQAGVHKRNPPWKIALFIALLVLVPVGTLFLLAELHVVPLHITRVNEQGEEVQESVFSAEGVSGLKALLLGQRSAVATAPPRRRVRAEPRPPGSPSEAPVAGGAEEGRTGSQAGGVTSVELERLYGSSGASKKDVGPLVRKDAQVAATDTWDEGGPPPEDVQRVVGQTQPAFQACIEQELRKNPSFRGGKVNLLATVGSSGTVKRTLIDRRDIEGSDLGACLKQRARRMVFSAFSGDEVDVEIPLILTGRM